MYGKVFDSIYDGTLYGRWEAIVTMQQLIVLADADGTVDMTPPAISARTSIPLEIIEKGLQILSEPDPYSRTPGEEGRRIQLLDDHRPWGWYLVNHAKYKNLQDSDTIRFQNRERKRRQREKEKCCAESRAVTDGHAKSRHTDTYTDTDTNTNTNKASKGRAFALPDWVPQEPWDSWLEVRKKLRAPNTDKALKLAVGDLEKFRSQGQDLEAILDQSTKRGWRGLFPLRSDSSPDYEKLARE